MSTTESSPDTPTRGPARPLPYVISGVALVLSIVLPLVVPMYASKNPEFAGFPFFYWYQMLWVPICAALIGLSYALMTKEDKRRRAVLRTGRSATDAGGVPPAASGSDDGGAVK